MAAAEMSLMDSAGLGGAAAGMPPSFVRSFVQHHLVVVVAAWRPVRDRVLFRAGVLASHSYSQSSLSAPRMAALNPVSPSIGSTDLGQKVKTGAYPKSHPGER